MEVKVKKAVTGYERVIGTEMSLQWRRDSEPLSSPSHGHGVTSTAGTSGTQSSSGSGPVPRSRGLK